jgi:adenylate kinase
MNEGLLVSDDLAQGLVVESIQATLANPDMKGVLLDGYPRTLMQAEMLDNALKSLSVFSFKVVDVKLETKVAVAKLLGRVQCLTCGESFNTADVVEGSFDMPAILPNKDTCKMKELCNPVLTTRGDDTEETITTRLQQHDINIAPILAYYERTGALRTFNVYKGVKDVDALIEVILN